MYYLGCLVSCFHTWFPIQPEFVEKILLRLARAICGSASVGGVWLCLKFFRAFSFSLSFLFFSRQTVSVCLRVSLSLGNNNVVKVATPQRQRYQTFQTETTSAVTAAAETARVSAHFFRNSFSQMKRAGNSYCWNLVLLIRPQLKIVEWENRNCISSRALIGGCNARQVQCQRYDTWHRLVYFAA